MSKSRSSIFNDHDTNGDITSLDLTGFAPKSQVDRDAPPIEKVRAVSQAAKFPSREPAAVKPEQKAKTPRREPRRYRTGRNVQVSVKALSTTVDSLYEITDQQGWVLGYTLQRAIEALQRELKQSQ